MPAVDAPRAASTARTVMACATGRPTSLCFAQTASTMTAPHGRFGEAPLRHRPSCALTDDPHGRSTAPADPRRTHRRWNAGCVTGYDADRPFSAANLRLATLLQDDVLGALNARDYDVPDEGVLPDTDLGSALTSAALAIGIWYVIGVVVLVYLYVRHPARMPESGPSEFTVTGTLKTRDIMDRLAEIAVSTLLVGGRYDECPRATWPTCTAVSAAPSCGSSRTPRTCASPNNPPNSLRSSIPFLT